VARRPSDKLLAAPPQAKGGRRQQYSSATKRALVDVAARLFTAHGYAATSLDAIVAGARVTKGALYHHFTGKQALFEAVFARVEGDAARRIRAALEGTSDPWEKALAGLRAFLDVVQEPGYQRVVVQEGPAILGYERFREQEERSSYAIVQDIVRSVLEAGTLDLDEAMVGIFSRIFFGAMSAAGETVTAAADPKVAVAQVETAITFIISGFRALADNGVQLPDPSGLLAPGRGEPGAV
jgi:AcrR family transcriptional regulator